MENNSESIETILQEILSFKTKKSTKINIYLTGKIQKQLSPYKRSPPSLKNEYKVNKLKNSNLPDSKPKCARKLNFD